MKNTPLHRGALAIAAGLVLFTSACSDSPGDGSGADDEGAASSGASSQASTPEPSASPEATAAPAPTLASDDPFCAVASESIVVSNQIVDKTAGMADLIGAALASGDVTAINTWGNELADLDAQILDLYAQGEPYVQGETVEGSWTTMESFIRNYSHELARIAATTPDTESFTGAMAEITTREGITDLLTQVPAAAEEIRVYVEDRCGVLG